ncbi:vWA domain-containing protein [Allorhizocola rhizosphaerae]|uniref:vWA domain-containing protein n=1 Tax=Allorhizocola rhizosphaerae TaxID=1872709 RepID=UPI000E3C2CBC|nr:vWA domain-containing protein [Allorhizocola rhizosphaerae]
MRRLLITTGTVLVTLLAATPALAVDGNLPGGTSISVTITSPANGSVHPPGPVTVTGTASVGTGVPVANTSLTYVIDSSGSTGNPGHPSCGNILQCEIAAALALSADTRNGTIAEVGAVTFGEAATIADVTPGGGDDRNTGPSTDANGNGTPDIDEVISSTFSAGFGQFTNRSVGSGSTNFADAIAKARTVTDAQTKARKIVVFMSDGFANTGGSINVPLTGIPDNVDIFTFAVGTGANCTNTGQNGEGSLEQITAGTVPGGHCVQVTDVGQLPDVLPGIISSQLTQLSMQIDNGSFNPIGNADITPDLPQNGPASVTYSAVTPALAAGTHQICVRANGTDGGGAGFVTDCRTIIINAPPVVDPGGPFSGQEGTPVTIAGTVTDPDGPSLTTLWTIAPQSGVDPGATCAFTDASLQMTTVRCTDDGVYRLTLTADDGVNPPVSADTTLTLTNVAPQVSISAPVNNLAVPRGTNVAFTAPFTDIGTNDTHTCTIDFDDGTPVVNGTVNEVPGSGTCTTSHVFTALGPHNVLVTVTDDDGASATAVVRVVVFLPGGAFALEAKGLLLTVPRTPDVRCPPNEARTVVRISAPPLLSTGVLNASCTIDMNIGRTVAYASVDGATLLGGAIQLSLIESTCTADADGITRSSRVVGTINGQPISAGPATIGIPGVATVHLNESTTGPGGLLVQNAVRVEVLGLLGIVTETIILSSCYLG